MDLSRINIFRSAQAWKNLYLDEAKRRRVVEKALYQVMEENQLAGEVIPKLIVRVAEESRRADMWRNTCVMNDKWGFRDGS